MTIPEGALIIIIIKKNDFQLVLIPNAYKTGAVLRCVHFPFLKPIAIKRAKGP